MASMLTMVLCIPAAAWAQVAFVVEGRITDPNGTGIENAIVELEGRDPMLTSGIGSFRFEDVGAGTYVLAVRALGYAPTSRSISVNENVMLAIVLEPAPFELDPVIVVAPDEIDLDGRVRDPTRDVHIMGADVWTSQGEQGTTDAHGRFSLDALEEVPIMVAIRAFGYLPLDTVLVPTEDDDYDFDLAVDPLVDRMIEVEIERLKERAGGLRAVTMRPMNRDDLLRWVGLPLGDVLRAGYPGRVQRVRCVIVDEVALTPQMVGPTLENLLVQEVERIEFLFRGAMLRIYTREFMRRMIGGGLELGAPTYVDMFDPPFCT
jgi:hypothetical protein